MSCFNTSKFKCFRKKIV